MTRLMKKQGEIIIDKVSEFRTRASKIMAQAIVSSKKYVRKKHRAIFKEKQVKSKVEKHWLEGSDEMDVLKDFFYPETQDKFAKVNLVTEFKTNRDTVAPKTNSKQPHLLLDSGADVSLIKQNIIVGIEIDKTDILSLTGIGKGKIRTIGAVMLEMEFDHNFQIKHKMYVVPDDFPINEDGIIGRDFFDEYKVDIRYSSNTIQIGTRQIPFSNQTTNTIVLPARSETIIEIRTMTNETSLCEACEVATGVFIPRMLIQPVNYKAKILIANTLNYDTQIKNVQTLIEPYQPQTMTHGTEIENRNKTNSAQVDKNREEQILEIITGNLDVTNNPEENLSILMLCMKYQDIFYLEGDRLTSVKGVQHEINLYTDSKPVHVQRYRLPQHIRTK